LSSLPSLPPPGRRESNPLVIVNPSSARFGGNVPIAYRYHHNVNGTGHDFRFFQSTLLVKSGEIAAKAAPLKELDVYCLVRDAKLFGLGYVEADCDSIYSSRLSRQEFVALTLLWRNSDVRFARQRLEARVKLLDLDIRMTCPRVFGVVADLLTNHGGESAVPEEEVQRRCYSWLANGEGSMWATCQDRIISHHYSVELHFWERLLQHEPDHVLILCMVAEVYKVRIAVICSTQDEQHWYSTIRPAEGSGLIWWIGCEVGKGFWSLGKGEVDDEKQERKVQQEDDDQEEEKEEGEKGEVKSSGKKRMRQSPAEK
jgi:hypothetical protein